MTNFTLLGLWDSMGPIPRGVVIVLLIMSMFALAISVERLLAFRRGRLQSMGYIGALQPLVTAPGRLREAAGLDGRWRASPVARVIASGINEYVRSLDKLGARAGDPAQLELVVDGVGRSMERVKERELMNLRRGLPGLATISSSAPFVGLLGTVFGIITAFSKMADPSSGGGLAAVSGGIAEALLTTAVGLTVAIVSVWFYNFFVNKVDHVTVDVDETAGEVLECMMRDGESLAYRR
jgi:biopolymer transport protein ExbB/TolQ